MRVGPPSMAAPGRMPAWMPAWQAGSPLYGGRDAGSGTPRLRRAGRVRPPRRFHSKAVYAADLAFFPICGTNPIWGVPESRQFADGLVSRIRIRGHAQGDGGVRKRLQLQRLANPFGQGRKWPIAPQGFLPLERLSTTRSHGVIRTLAPGRSGFYLPQVCASKAPCVSVYPGRLAYVNDSTCSIPRKTE